jgi:glycosyltransferase involved in cell wall biosynthesis
MPGRLHRWKRVDLIIEAFKYVKNDIRLKIAGIGEDESRFRHLAANDDRIEFLGSVSDQVLVDLYSNALAVPFVPLREDYGYVTLEAFRSEKPVITCHDSGETTYFVKNRHSGFVCEPTPRIIAQKIDYLCKHPEKAKEMGENGKKAILDIKWDNIIERLAKYF